MESAPDVERISTVARLDRDLRRAAAEELSPHQARYLVDLYYNLQNERIRANNQVVASEKAQEPHTLVDWFLDQNKTLEHSTRAALGSYVETTETGLWSLSVYGMGPVLSAGLLAHIDVTIGTNPSKIWSFAGLNPNAVWEKKQKKVPA